MMTSDERREEILTNIKEAVLKIMKELEDTRELSFGRTHAAVAIAVTKSLEVDRKYLEDS